MKLLYLCLSALISVQLFTVACAPASAPATTKPTLNVLATETFLADIAQNVAGAREKVNALMPVGIDPHSFEPTPADIKKVADSNVLIINGAGVESFMARLLENAGGKRLVIEASKGLTSRKPSAGEPVDADNPVDPHFWLDPNNVVKYVENIRDGLSQVDPNGAAAYAANAAAYIAKLKELDQWIADQVKPLPPARRLLVTNHEEFGYFADRYGFKIIGAIIPSFSTDASPSAQQLAQLIDHVKSSKAPAIFLEISANPQMANQVARETGAKLVTDLYTHSISDANGPAPTYIDMMKYDVKMIVDALK
ncbi:MAG: zinc ABC transporter substrate-binding protein [Chloroflexota bacterium]|nr:zinc ABC transporter substrate-binding protein [Chloroflexota bacterium]